MSEFNYSEMVYDINNQLGSEDEERDKVRKIYYVGKGDVNAFLSLLPSDVTKMISSDPKKFNQFFKKLHATSVDTVTKCIKAGPKVAESIEETLLEVNVLYVDTTQKDVRRRLIYVTTGAVIVSMFIAYLYYRKQRKVFGELYSFKDLLKDIWKLFKKLTVKLVSEFWSALIKVLATALVILLLATVVVYLLPADFLTEQKGGKVGNLVRYVLKVVLKVKSFESNE